VVRAYFGPPVRVLSIPVASKREALRAGDEAAKDFPRIYVDADVELAVADIRALGAALSRPGALAGGPQRDLDLAGRPWLVRSYYAVWERLPEVRSGLFGRGVIGLSEAGYTRVADLPPLLADDLVASLAFQPAVRVIVPGARVVVHTLRTFRDLLRRRVRTTMGVSQVEAAEGCPGLDGPDPAPRSAGHGARRTAARPSGRGISGRGGPRAAAGGPGSAAPGVLDLAAG
jgi:hypothetical protein